MSKESLDEDEMSDFDDDDYDNEITTDWINEEDEEIDEEVEKAPVVEKVKVTDPFLLEHIDTYMALLDNEDLNFDKIEYQRQVEMIKSLTIISYQKGEIVCQDEDPDPVPFYIIIASERTAKIAEVEVIRKAEDKTTKVVSRIKRGQVVGQKFFLYKQSDASRDCTIKIPDDSPCAVYIARLDKEHFQLWNNFRHALLVRSVPLMQLVPPKQRQEIVAHLTVTSFPKDAYIITKGELGDEFFIIIDGAVNILDVSERPGPNGTIIKDEKKVVTLHEGHFFGEMSLINNEKRVASVKALTDAVCLCLKKNFFDAALSSDVLDNIREEVEKRKKMREQRQQQQQAATPSRVSSRSSEDVDAGSHVKVTSTVTLRKATTGDRYINKYLIVKELGRGSYAEVCLAKDETTGVYYAMKIMARPAKALSNEYEEIAIMKKLRHPNIVMLHEVIDDPNSRKIYIIQEYVARGALMDDVEVCEPFSVEQARKYFRDTLKGIRYLHSKGIVHRDIKPQNLLVAADGTVKLADFGAAVLSGIGSTYAAGGTPSFMAPELFQVSGSNPEGIDLHKTDIWSLGVTLYFMVMGRTPWQVGNEIELAHCVQNMVIQFPDEKVDPHLKFLLRQMLERNYNKRIDLNGVLTDDWVTQEGTDPLLSEQEVIDEETRAHTGHVLLVDSNAGSRNQISLKLDQANCTHMISSNGNSAIECIKSTLQPSQFAMTPFGLILIADELSDGPGIDVLIKLREMGYTGFIIGTMDNSGSSSENLLRFDTYRANFIQNGGTQVWGKSIRSIDIIELFAKAALEPTNDEQTSSNSADHKHSKPNDSNDVPLSVKELKEAVVHIPASKGMNTYGSHDSFGISEISSRGTTPSESIASTTSPSDDASIGGSINGGLTPNAVKIIPRKLSKKGTMEASFMMHDSDFHLGNSFLPRVNSLEPYNMSLRKQGSERTLSRTRDFMLVPADIVLIPSKDKKGGVEKSIAYKGIDNMFKGGESSIATLRKAKREKAMQKSKQVITKMNSGAGDQELERALGMGESTMSLDEGEEDDDDEDFGEIEIEGPKGSKRHANNDIANITIVKSNSSMSLLSRAKTSSGLAAVFEHDENSDGDNDDLGEFDLSLNSSGAKSRSPGKDRGGADSSDDEEEEEEGEDFVGEDDDDEDYDGEVTFMGASEFDQMMDEMSIKKKTNVHDDTWNKIFSNVQLPPITASTSHCNDDLRLRYSTFDSIGLRPYMEDRVFATGDLNKEYFTNPYHTEDIRVGKLNHLKLAYFGVYDGHNGYYVAEHLQQRLHRTLYEILAKKQQMGAENESKSWIHDSWTIACTAADRDIVFNDFKRQSAGLHSGTLAMEVFGGSVAAMCLLVEDVRKPLSERMTAYMAWVGDCRAVISDSGVAVQVTDDHKPTLPKERERIEAAGGWVHKNRVNGLLAVSRSFGDINYKQVEDTLFEEGPEIEKLTDPTEKSIATSAKMVQWSHAQQVMGLPETKELKIKDTHEFMIMASDGVWDVFSCQEAVNFVRHFLIHNNGNLELAAEKLIREAEARDTQDNVSVIIFAFHQVDFSF